MVLVHEIRDEDEEFESQLVRNDSIDDYTTDDEDYYYEETEDFEGGSRYLSVPAFQSGPVKP